MTVVEIALVPANHAGDTVQSLQGYSSSASLRISIRIPRIQGLECGCGIEYGTTSGENSQVYGLASCASNIFMPVLSPDMGSKHPCKLLKELLAPSRGQAVLPLVHFSNYPSWLLSPVQENGPSRARVCHSGGHTEKIKESIRLPTVFYFVL